MADERTVASPWKDSTLQSVGLIFTSFLAGLYIGRKLSRTASRVSKLFTTGPTKLVLVARDDLRLGKGKLAAQCSHATIAAYKKMQRVNPSLLQAWEDSGQPKVVVRALDMEHIKELSQMAEKAGVETCLIRDAGRTQVQFGTATVLAVGPGAVADVDKVTGSLRLL